MNKLEELSQKIAEAKELYYSTGTSPLTDQQYDRLVEQAEKLGFIDYVGSKPVSSIPVIKHEHLMLSLNKVHNIEEIEKFAGNKDVVFMYKCDGLTCSATYIDGVLTRLETRGNGTEGNNVLFHTNSFMNLPKYIDKGGKYVIDGECIIFQDDFNAINKHGEFSNPRNLASGSLNQLDPKISAQRRLNFYAWDIIEGGCSNYLSKNLLEAERLGFECAPFFVGEDTKINIDVLIYKIKEQAEHDGFPIDGVVIKFDDISYGKSLGRTDKYFKNAVAYKYEDETYKTKLRNVIWQVGKTKQITPIAVFDPIEIDGSIVERCSLHNISIMKELNLTRNCTVYVYKANSIIPQIDSADFDGDEQIPIPETCPVCGAPTKVINENGSEVLVCTNPNCTGALLGRFKHFVSKKGMDIDGLNEKTLEAMLKLDMLHKFSDLYHPENWADKLLTIPGFGKRSVEKLLKAIEASRHVSLGNFICALSIDGIGPVQAQNIASTFGSWEKFYEVGLNGVYDFTRIEGIGDKLARNITSYLRSDYDLPNLCGLLVISGTDSCDSVSNINDSGLLAGKTFVITGKLNNFVNRDALVADIKAHGGKAASSVSKNTNYLINNDSLSKSSKNVRAQSLGVIIITEDEYLEMIK